MCLYVAGEGRGIHVLPGRRGQVLPSEPPGPTEHQPAHRRQRLRAAPGRRTDAAAR